VIDLIIFSFGAQKPLFASLRLTETNQAPCGGRKRLFRISGQLSAQWQQSSVQNSLLPVWTSSRGKPLIKTTCWPDVQRWCWCFGTWTQVASERSAVLLFWVGGCPADSEYTQNSRFSRFLCYCCNLSGGVALIVWFTMNGMCVKNNTTICVARASHRKRDCEHDLYCCLLPRCEALRTCRSGFPIATLHLKLSCLWWNHSALKHTLLCTKHHFCVIAEQRRQGLCAAEQPCTFNELWAFDRVNSGTDVTTTIRGAEFLAIFRLWRRHSITALFRPWWKSVHDFIKHWNSSESVSSFASALKENLVELTL